MNRRWLQLSLQIGSSLAIHALLFWVLQLWNIESNPLVSRLSPEKIPVLINFEERSRGSAPELTASEKKQIQEKEKKLRQKPFVQTPSRPLTHAPSYANLLPIAGDLSVFTSKSKAKDSAAKQAENAQEGSFAQHHFGGGLNGVARQSLLRDGGTLATLFDVPLALREQGQRLKAFAAIKMNVKNPDLLEIEYLEGAPILRAVIYEALLQERTQKVLREILPLLVGGRLRLEIITDPNGRQQADVDSSFFWSGSSLKLIKTPPPRSGVAGLAIPLPDHAAKVAKAWDRQALMKLHDSLAYRVPLRARKL